MTDAPERPGIWGRVLAATQGEVSAELLEAYRRAGSAIHRQLDHAEKRRLDLKLAGKSPWEAGRHEQLELLCTWNAFALQTLGDKMLDADYAEQPATAYFVPRVTFDQVQAYYGQVEGWLGRARAAEGNPQYGVDVSLPASLPSWSPVEPCPRPHLGGMLAALKAMRLHATAALHVFEGEGTPKERQADLARLRQLFGEAEAKTEYAERLYAPNATAELHERVEEHAKNAVELYYRLGQLLSMPSLLGRNVEIGRPQGNMAKGRLPLPTEPGFDPWVMTDPEHKANLQQDAQARRAIEEMWRFDPAPERTLALYGEIEAARARGDVAYATSARGQRIGHFFCTPYAPIYVARRTVVIGGQRLGTAQQFTLEAATEGVRVGYAFKRGLVTGNFKAAELDYCDPDAPPPHDD